MRQPLVVDSCNGLHSWLLGLHKTEIISFFVSSIIFVILTSSSLVGGPRTAERHRFWIQKVFVSLGVKRFSNLWVCRSTVFVSLDPKGFRIFTDLDLDPKGFRIFRIRKVFVSFGSKKFLHLCRRPPSAQKYTATMGGDGGTIGSTRAYLRGAGKASHTADHPSSARERSKKKAASDDVAGRAKLILSTCAVSGEVLDISSPRASAADGGGVAASSSASSDIVACPYGRLYKREKIIEALLRRARSGADGDHTTDGHAQDASISISHIRGMKDLHPVRFHVTTISTTSRDVVKSNGKTNGSHLTPVCPITGSDIGSGKVPSYVIVRSSTTKMKSNGVVDDEASRGPNVLSERAIKEMSVQGLQAEFGPFDEKDMILLAPPLTGGVFDEIKRKWEERVELERVAKVSGLLFKDFYHASEILSMTCNDEFSM